VALGAEWLFVHTTHALQITARSPDLSAAAARQLALEHRGVLVIAMLLGALIAMVFSIGVTDPTPVGQLVTMLILPVAMVAGLAVGLAIGAHRVESLSCLVVLLTAGTWCRRFGPRGVIGGILLFVGALLGYFVRPEIPLSHIGWPVAEIGIGVAVAVAIHFTAFRSQPAKAVSRMQRSWVARSRSLIDLAARAYLYPEQSHRLARRLHRQAMRLNEATLMIDAQIVGPNALPAGCSPELFHQRLFDMELALTNVARFATALSGQDLPDEQHRYIRQALTALRSGDLDDADVAAWALYDRIGVAPALAPYDRRVAETVPHRFAVSVIDFIAAQRAWLAATPSEIDGAGDGFRPAAPLVGGWLLGAATVSVQASTTPGVRRGHRLVLSPHLRTTIQIGVAATAATIAGDALSGRRFYWSLIAVVVSFLAITNSGEQARRAFFRVAGTLVGIGAGSIAAHAVGPHSNWAIGVILGSIFLGLYLIRINYGLFVIGITVAVAQLYVQLGEFSNRLLVQRLEETAVGAAISILTVVLVLPIHPRRVIAVAVIAYFDALATLIGHATDHPVHPVVVPNLRADIRALDAAHHSLFATAQPLRHTLFGDVSQQVETALTVATAVRYYARDLIADLGELTLRPPDVVPLFEEATATLRSSLGALLDGLRGRPTNSYTRSASLFDRVEVGVEVDQHLPVSSAPPRHRPSGVQALHDLMLLDGSLALLADAVGVAVTDFDTATHVPLHRRTPPQAG
jgi:uncharacterized membrane protein YccC